MTHKSKSAWLAAGFWGRDPHCRIAQEQLPEKEKVLLEDKLLADGRPADLWLPVTEATPGTVHCTCDKNTRPGADYKCLSCNGTRHIPGYQHFLHEVLFFASAEYASFTLTNVERDTTIKPNRLRLARTALTGTVETPDKAFTNPKSAPWLVTVAAFRQVATDTITAEFSTDAGATWADVSTLPALAATAGTLRFRITLTRVALSTTSPDFEIVRAQHAQPEKMTARSKSRKDLRPGQILILRGQIMLQVLRQLATARQSESLNDAAWTASLAFFDRTLTDNTYVCVINDDTDGPHPFIQHASGITQGVRFAITQVNHNDNLLDVLTFQSFVQRKPQRGENYYLVD